MPQAPNQEAANNLDMSEEICDALFADATELAYQSFDYPTDDHVECVYFPAGR